MSRIPIQSFISNVTLGSILGEMAGRMTMETFCQLQSFDDGMLKSVSCFSQLLGFSLPSLLMTIGLRHTDLFRPAGGLLGERQIHP